MRRLFAGLLMISLQSFAVPRSLSWKEAVDLAAQKNLDVQSSVQSLQATQSLEGTSQSGFYPQISATASETQSNTSSTTSTNGIYTNSYSAQLSLSQNLFSGFLDTSKSKQAKANSESAKASLQIAKAKISSDLKQAYEALAYAEKYRELTASIIKRREENLRNVELRFEGGRENKGSVLLSRAYFQQAKYEDLQAQHVYEIASAQLAKILNLAPDTELKLVDSLPLVEPSTQKPDFDSIAKSTPEFQQAQATEESVRQDIELSRALFFPSLDLSASVGKIDSQFFPNNDKWSAGLTLSIPLFNGGRDLSNTRAASLRWGASNKNKEITSRQVLIKLKQAYANYVEAIEKSKVDEAFRKAAEIRADIARNKYNNGLMTFEEWDLVENDLIARQKASLTSQKDRVTNEAAWEQAQGIGVLL